MDKNTRQPVAWMCDYIEDGEHEREYNGHNEFSCGRIGVPLFRLPPVPRAVLMDLAKSVESELITGGYVALTESQLSTVVDRYASQVQPDGNCKFPLCQNEQYQNDMAEALHRELYAGQPEPVNQQLLASLKDCMQFLDAGCNACTVSLNSDSYPCHSCNRVELKATADKRKPRQFFIDANAAIAAAEVAQNVGEQPRCACGDSFTIDAVCANCLAAKQPDSTQPVAVPDEHDPAVAVIAFVLDLERKGYCGEGIDFLRLWNEGEFEVCRREWPDAPPECYIGADPLMDAAQNPEGV